VRIRQAVAGHPGSGQGVGAPAVTAERSDEADSEGVELTPVAVKLVGMFHLKRPDDPAPLVEQGAFVTEGQVIGAIEALGKWANLVSPVTGVVVEIVAEDHSPVQYGDVVMRIEPREEGE
jgi:acetyl-CoA carboxylase biotin carboxyl carrier protein